MLYSVKLATCLVLASLAVSDLLSRRLPTRSVLIVAGLYCVAAALVRIGAAAFLSHVGVAATALAVYALLFRFGWIAGGDVKLAAAVFLWAGPSLAAPVFVIVSVCGLILGLGVIAADPLYRRVGALRWLSCLSCARGVPYGIALALGGGAAVWAPLAHSAPIV
ncbi:prepilin peptidase [Paraburkholderia sp. BL10I2N1]|uniref:A24 family peptidase n=1 Tax=Paraburkholderia sp. BL10I2N1 TaxID=1938796 RepID=UPI0010615CCA|nr:prepilin peptidase [Paraburkholderia sp. BL10I2N1]TDN67278.1 prepilin peptidase CpaA [Paraburkholderia sp. BL10I2N1]